MTPEEDVKPTIWNWIKFIGWYALVSVFAFLILPHAAFNLLTDLCGKGADSCSPEATFEWLISTTVGGIAVVVIAAAVVWMYVPFFRSLASGLAESTRDGSKSLAVLVLIIVVLPLGLSILVFVDLFHPFSRQPSPSQLLDFKEIKVRYLEHSENFDSLAQQLDGDHEVVELYCDPSMVYVSTPEETYYAGENDYYTSKYTPICRFSRKVAAQRSQRGIRFPHRFIEHDSWMLNSFLEWRRNPNDVLGECSSAAFEGDYGACEVIIDDHWSASVIWEPFCLEYMGEAEGC